MTGKVCFKIREPTCSEFNRKHLTFYFILKEIIKNKYILRLSLNRMPFSILLYLFMKYFMSNFLRAIFAKITLFKVKKKASVAT